MGKKRLSWNTSRRDSYKKFKLTCKSHELESKPYDDWAYELSDEEVVDNYLDLSEKVKRLNKSYDWIQELRDRHFKFSKAYKDFNGLAKRFCSELNEYIPRQNALGSEILARCGSGIGPIIINYEGPFKRLPEAQIA